MAFAQGRGAQGVPAVVAMELIVHALQTVKIADVSDSQVCFPNKHVFWRQLCQLQYGATLGGQHQ